MGMQFKSSRTVMPNGINWESCNLDEDTFLNNPHTPFSR